MERLKSLSKEDLICVINFLMLHNLNNKRDLDIALNDLKHSKTTRTIALEEKAFEEYIKARTDYSNYALELSNAGRRISDEEWDCLVELNDKASQALAKYERLSAKVNKQLGVCGRSKVDG